MVEMTETVTGAEQGVSRRGRPLRLPDAILAPGALRGQPDHRVSWLLAVSRVYSPDPAHHDRTAFIDRLRGAGLNVDPSRVSRWESGAVPVSVKAIGAYEQVLGPDRGMLRIAIAAVGHSMGPVTPSLEVFDDDVPDADLDELIAGISDDDHDGAYWGALCRQLTRHDLIYLPNSTWSDLAGVLLRELARSTGFGYLHRYEAFRSLVRHPSSRRHAVRQLGSFVTHADAQEVAMPLTLLQEVDEDTANLLVLRMLSGRSETLRSGSRWVAAIKLGRGHFAEDTFRKFEALAVRNLLEAPPDQPDLGWIDIAARLPAEHGYRVLAATRPGAQNALLEQALATGELTDPYTARRRSETIAGTVQQRTPTTVRIEQDAMLQRLVRELLYHSHQERRHQAVQLIAASPYADEMARACLKLAGSTDDSVAARALAFLDYHPPESARPQLRQIAESDERAPIRLLAFSALAGMPAGLDEALEETLVTDLGQARGDRERSAILNILGRAGAAVLTGLALGRVPLVGSGPDDTNEPADPDDTVVQKVARGASWWLDLGGRINGSGS